MPLFLWTQGRYPLWGGNLLATSVIDPYLQGICFLPDLHCEHALYIGTGLDDGPTRSDMIGYKVNNTLRLLDSIFKKFSHPTDGASSRYRIRIKSVILNPFCLREWLSMWGRDEEAIAHLSQLSALVTACLPSQEALLATARMLAQGCCAD